MVRQENPSYRATTFKLVINLNTVFCITDNATGDVRIVEKAKPQPSGARVGKKRLEAAE